MDMAYYMLPETSFIPFKAYRLKFASVIWVNIDLLHKYGLFLDKCEADDDIKRWLLEQFAYTTCISGGFVDSDDSSTFLAERYGGQAISYNGGGARTGIKGKFQVKGIGPNLLVGEGSGYWYSHGGATLLESVKEAMWGEVCNIILPHGSVRCLAVIETGISTTQDVSKEKIISPGGMVVRENSLRVAHFERAAFFRPQSQYDISISDYDRTSSAVRTFPKIINALVKSEHFCMGDCLKQLISRWADQVAYSKSVKLMHGALTSSNLSLDGRWIDFGTTSTLGAHTNVITALGNPAFWSEHEPLCESIANLCFYVNKFLSENTLNIGEMICHFKYSYNLFMRRYFIALLGYPIRYIVSVEHHPAVERFFGLIIRMIQLGRMKIHTGISLYEQSSGIYNIHRLNKIIMEAKHPSNRMEEDFISAFKEINDVICKANEISLIELEFIRTKELYKRVDNVDGLNVDIIHADISQLISRGADVGVIDLYVNGKKQLAKNMKVN
ncbi:protein adenylyltransferase SelO family protein [Aeromonas hydrophila]|uniref:protein adenylyltransferase SelO family protein n=1 Tax=Aeromonas hydrophila TaxID=644 RepID=UPI0021E671E4|nr:protein adenylyltransferase SelO family protein [Aeromonas hydrophila]MCV3275095.1 protein adenylyltransferase SelO family protein [Aeromonas hydrophila]